MGESINLLEAKDYKIADILINVSNFTVWPLYLESFIPFEEKNTNNEYTYIIEIYKDVFNELENLIYLKEFNCSIGNIKCYKHKNYFIFQVYQFGVIIGEIIYNNNNIFKIKITNKLYLNQITNFCSLLAICTYKKNLSVLLIHASVIVKDEEAYVFYGESGKGKSTQCENWLRVFNKAFILNDDNPILYLKNGQLFVSGSPWSGKSNYYINKSYPVKALISIDKSISNKITTLTQKGFFYELLHSVSFNPIKNSATIIALSRILKFYYKTKCLKYNCQNSIKAPLYLHESLNKIFLSDKELKSVINFAIKKNCKLCLTVEGNSMFPTLQSGLTKVIIQFKNNNFKVGDIVLALSQKFKLHRIVFETSQSFILKGDANNWTEEVNKNDIIGKVIKII